MNVFDYIKNYAEAHGITQYNLKSNILTLNNIAKPLQASGAVLFFYKITAQGEIRNVTDLQKKFLEVSAADNWWDLSGAVQVQDFNTVQSVQTEFIFCVDNTANFKLYEGTADAMFANIYNLCAYYITLIPVLDAEKNDNKIKLQLKY